jgi:hypothetical protein
MFEVKDFNAEENILASCQMELVRVGWDGRFWSRRGLQEPLNEDHRLDIEEAFRQT